MPWAPRKSNRSKTRSSIAEIGRVPSGILALIIIVPLLFGASAWGVAILDNSFSLQNRIVDTVRTNQRILRFQLDEETGIRGFELAERRIMLEPFEKAAGAFPSSFNTLEAQLRAIGITKSRIYVDELRHEHDEWMTRFADRVLQSHYSSPAMEVAGKTIIDRFRAGSIAISNAIQQRGNEASARAARVSTSIRCVHRDMYRGYAAGLLCVTPPASIT